MSKKIEIIQTAAELLQIQGYHGTGINEIVEKSKSPKGSIYHYFKAGKDEIVDEALRYSGSEIANLLKAAAEHSKNAEDFIEIIYDGYCSSLQNSNYTKGCPVAATALEVSGFNAALSDTVRKIYKEWNEIITDFLLNSNAAAKKKSDAEQTAGVLISLMEGALLSARIQKSLKPMKDAKNVSLSLLKK